MPTESETRSRRESWPPTQVRIEPATSTGGEKKNKNASYFQPRALLLEDIDENPLTYFLTPSSPSPASPSPEDGDDEYLPMDFDAGIEDPSHPHEMVRSVSPSALEGLSKPDRPSSPECDSDLTSTDEEDEEDEDYIRFSPYNSRLTSFRHLQHIDVPRSQSPVFGRSANALLSPASFASPSPARRGNPMRNGGGHYRLGRSRTLPIRSRSGHTWREPSPDVWAIEEETEEQMNGNIGEGKATEPGKPKKRVRFVLPVKE